MNEPSSWGRRHRSCRAVAYCCYRLRANTCESSRASTLHRVLNKGPIKMDHKLTFDLLIR